MNTYHTYGVPPSTPRQSGWAMWQSVGARPLLDFVARWGQVWLVDATGDRTPRASFLVFHDRAARFVRKVRVVPSREGGMGRDTLEIEISNAATTHDRHTVRIPVADVLALAKAGKEVIQPVDHVSAAPWPHDPTPPVTGRIEEVALHPFADDPGPTVPLGRPTTAPVPTLRTDDEPPI